MHAMRGAGRGVACRSCRMSSERTYRLTAIGGRAEDALQLAKQQVDLLSLVVLDQGARQKRVPAGDQSVVVIGENG